MDIKRLKRAIQGQIFCDEETLLEVNSDFGGIVRKTPKVVVLPTSPHDVQQVVRIAFQEGWSVTSRGAAHSQGGQCLSQEGILLDMSTLNRIEKMEKGCVWAQAGSRWRDVVARTTELELVPPVLVNNLDSTVGGTLSLGGLGPASHRYGAQADNVEELEVVTGEGHRVRCSHSENAELFNSSLCGLGQFSIITRARLSLRKCEPKIRTYFLLYDDLVGLMRDQERVMVEQRFDYIESWSVPSPQGFRKLEEILMPFAEWFYPLHLAVEYTGDEPDDKAKLGDLHFYRKVHVEDSTLMEFVNRSDALFQQWKETGVWNFTHPWMEVLLPWTKAAPFIEGVLRSLPLSLLSSGQVSLRSCRPTLFKAPLFKSPQGEFCMSFGILAAVSKQFLPMALPLLNRASNLSMDLEGKRDLSGWIDFDHKRWKTHFGETWTKLARWKNFYDPKGILNPGFIQYSD